MTAAIAIFLLSTSFVAGFLDSIAGGGGLLLLPALLFSGLPPQIALGTNKFAATIGLFGSFINFVINKKVMWEIVKRGIVFSLLGGFLGSRSILLFSNEAVGKIILFFLPLALLATLIPRENKGGEAGAPPGMLPVKIPVICFAAGFYDGFFGPGSSSFLILALNLFAGLDLVNASATAKPFTVISCITSSMVFLWNGKVLISLGLFLAMANIAGNYAGSKLVIRKGTTVVRTWLVASLVILFVFLSLKYVVS
ncbi:MAG TPA: sulfite exporter TauE/SafE family protein [Methylomusa anaerophila]|uniref:Probable membrane transporter protein n=1 Tax=Methylomusa anaerophila TaxID=1930071 RepID=A0A348AEN2_9FIRM|nr:sulfite exporter TauE/SafE family protein [Methylomusa anaerophila]BBB89530.1 hypothetical protein MAMMFC1_00163 [Methylomusa anaerophila]HML90100.1 sulfite exporter TauE/SafE family protein [Methylomusa anaerophila]